MTVMYKKWAERCGVVDWPPGVGDWSFPDLADDGTFNMRGNGHIVPR
jgi:hypothetical protein